MTLTLTDRPAFVTIANVELSRWRLGLHMSFPLAPG
jgi:hypothetical protein